MEPAALALFAAALFVAAGSPGPSIAALVARVLTRGISGVLPFLAAMWIGEAIWLSLAVFGLSAIAQTFQFAFAVLKWAGVAYLVWLAWKMWAAPTNAAPENLPPTDAPLHMFGAGIAVTLGNPKIMIFYMALLPSIIDLDGVTVSGWVELTATMMVVLMIIDLGWAAMASAARRFFKSARAVRAVNRGSATIMAGAAAVIAVR